MRSIPLGFSKARKHFGLTVLVDDSDYEQLSKYNWNAKWDDHSRTFYAQRASKTKDGRRTTVAMHRQILGITSNRKVDHENGDGLDNRRENLRMCSDQQNCMNRRKQRTKTSSAFKGVSWHRRQCKWVAYISINSRREQIGSFTSEKAAARAYDRLALQYFGDFARTNF